MWFQHLSSSSYGLMFIYAYFFVSPLGVLRYKMAGDIGPTPLERKFHNLRSCVSYIWKSEGYRGFFKGFWGSIWGGLVIAGSIALFSGVCELAGLSQIPYAYQTSLVMGMPIILGITYFYAFTIPANLMITAGVSKTHADYPKLKYQGLRNSFKEASWRVAMRGGPICSIIIAGKFLARFIQSNDRSKFSHKIDYLQSHFTTDEIEEI